MTNAIKFTKAENRRKIEVEYGVTSSNPRDSFPKDIKWAPNHREVEDLTEHPEWGLGQPLYFTISVTDTGIGMTGDEIKRLFGRFKQANARTSIKYGGSGLGLFLSGRLAEKQSGEIGVSSRSGHGSTFAFYVKSRQTERHGVSTPDVPQVALPIRSRSMSIASKIPIVDFNKIHVLLVEDNVVNQRIVQKQLVKAGCVVYVANHGLEALQMVRESDIWCEKGVESSKTESVTVTAPKHLDIILMDWQMPVMDGLTCSREIRKLENEKKITRHVEIIATTANARNEQIETALESGIDSVISKPFMVSDLLIKMKERLSIASDARNTAGYSFWE
ncbi:hypothetical protein VTL71DRAFT_13415 [Oculimacula yallundae]|uniref:Histidine kinase n=1 Tax=Oculimacula yallundae TaxID=86028 RepID=A0ABR4CK83_9HELO